MESRNIYLVGPMGVGKSAIGKALAQRLSRQFIDTDQTIELNTGVSIDWICEKEQEAGLLVREAALIETLSQQTGLLVSTGGGTILSEAVRGILRATGLVVYLSATIGTQKKRIQMTPQKRPALIDKELDVYLAEINALREPLYAELADYEFPTDHGGPHKIAEQIMAQLMFF